LICRGCVVRTECLADALDNRIEFGVWGGMTERERRALLRRRPDVTSWRDLLEQARNQYERQADDEAEDELVAS
jgi:WhiB family redox-sensing transcriptional regulator